MTKQIKYHGHSLVTGRTPLRCRACTSTSGCTNHGRCQMTLMSQKNEQAMTTLPCSPVGHPITATLAGAPPLALPTLGPLQPHNWNIRAGRRSRPLAAAATRQTHASQRAWSSPMAASNCAFNAAHVHSGCGRFACSATLHSICGVAASMLARGLFVAFVAADVHEVCPTARWAGVIHVRRHKGDEQVACQHACCNPATACLRPRPMAAEATQP